MKKQIAVMAVMISYTVSAGWTDSLMLDDLSPRSYYREGEKPEEKANVCQEAVFYALSCQWCKDMVSAYEDYKTELMQCASRDDLYAYGCGGGMCCCLYGCTQCPQIAVPGVVLLVTLQIAAELRREKRRQKYGIEKWD